MTQPPMIFDRTARTHALRRVREDCLFLHHVALLDLQERLKDINRGFTDACIVSFHQVPWAGALPGAFVPIPKDEVLPLPQGQHDLIVHAMSLHQVNDPLGQLIQCRRALRPDGLLIACCFGGVSLSRLRRTLLEAETKVMGGASPRVAPMIDIRDGGALLSRAGLTLPVADSVSPDRGMARYLGIDAGSAGDGGGQCAAHPPAPCHAPRHF